MMCSNCAVGGDCVEVVTKAVFRLWDIFGGTVNAKGYKVIFKDPKEGGFKKSQKGMCRVYRDERGALAFQDGYTSADILGRENLLEAVYRDGVLLREQSLAEIRDRLNNGNFGG